MASSSVFPELFAGLFSEAVQRFLSLAPNSRQVLAPMVGKIIEFRFAPFGWRLYLCPSESSIEILPSLGIAPDVTFTGSPLAFARMGLTGSPRRALFAGEVEVAGDMAVARRFQGLVEKLDIDWDGLLARFVGQGLATRIADGLRSSHAWRVETVKALELNVAEYLQEESCKLPAAAEAELFYAEVDTLRADCDRLEQKILRLQRF
jgi:ubiquinone biosynthesis protein UbiJ